MQVGEGDAVTVIEQMLQKYALNTHDDKTQALREVMQAISLSQSFHSSPISRR
jgi:hypothetical protein